MKKIAAFILGLSALLASHAQAELVFDNDVPAALQQQMQTDFQILATIKGDKVSPLHKRIFGNMDGASYVNFFNKRILSVGLNDCGGGAAFACVLPFADNTKMWIAQNYLTYDIPQILRLSVVLHESRHSENENGNWMHTDCPAQDMTGKPIIGIISGRPLVGLAACDDTAEGAYGIEAIFLKNVQLNCAKTSCTDKVRLDAQLYGNDTVKRITEPKAYATLAADLATK